MYRDEARDLQEDPTKVATLAALPVLIIPSVLLAQPRPSQVRAGGGLGIFVEAEEHALATVGWRKYVGTRGGGFEIEGLVMRGDDHHEAAAALDVVDVDERLGLGRQPSRLAPERPTMRSST